MLATLQARLATGLRRAAYSAGAGVSFLIGAVFFTVAAWIYLAETTSTQTAALIIGAVWLGLGFILMGLARSGSPRKARRQGSSARGERSSGDPGLAQAFLFGFEAGRGTSKRS